MLTRVAMIDWATRLYQYQSGELESLDDIYSYWNGHQPLPVVPIGVPNEVRRLAMMSRTNMLATVVSVMAQALYVDGYREDPANSDENAPAWGIWQANRMDGHQTGVHRAALAYGTSYVIVLPGEPVPLMRGVSPRSLVAMYDEDSHDWPRYAMEKVESPWSDTEYRLYDEDAIYTLEQRDPGPGFVIEPTRIDVHGLGVCPIVRFRNTDRLNEPPPPRGEPRLVQLNLTGGEIEPLMGLQDQIDVTTFDLLVGQHFQSFRQRYIMGWTADDEEARAKANASRLWTFEDPDTKVGEFAQIDLSGYLNSREATIGQLGVVSQTPGHELLGKMVNLSAEALAAAEVGQRRKVIERQQLFGQSWEQALALAGEAAGIKPSPEAAVRWKDTEARSMSQTIDALGKMVAMLNVPPEVLWERIPGVTQADVVRWQEAARELDAIAEMNQLLAAQMQPAPEGPPPAPELPPA